MKASNKRGPSWWNSKLQQLWSDRKGSNLQLIRFPLCFGKGKICFVWKTWATLQFLLWEKLVNFFEIPTLPNQWGTYFWVGCCDLYSPSNYDEATRKFGIGRFGRFEFLGLTLSTLQGAFIGDLEVSSWKKIVFFSSNQLISRWVKDPPSQTWKLKLSDWDPCGRSALRNTCPNCQLAFARSSRVFLLDLCWTLFEVARQKGWLWKAVN